MYTPFIRLEKFSIDSIEIETIPGFNILDDATVAVSITYDGIIYGSEWWALYGTTYDYNQRFIIRRLGICNDWMGFKFRGASTARMAFALMEVKYS